MVGYKSRGCNIVLIIFSYQADEQLEDETDEAFEERVLNKRAAAMFKVIRTKLVEDDSLMLSTFTQNSSKKMVSSGRGESSSGELTSNGILLLIPSQAAQKFYSLLVLKKFQALEIDQQVPFGDICIRRGDMFDNPKL